MNGADAIADILKREGTEFLACYPRQPLIEACARQRATLDDPTGRLQAAE